MAPRSPFSPGLERELGTPGILSIGGILETFEETAELRWPNNVIVFDRMRRTDSQVTSTLRAVNLPIRRTRWQIVGDNVRPEVRRFVEVELGLQPEQDGRRRRRRQGIVWDDFLSHVLIFLPMGHMAFEQVYNIDEPGPELDDVTGLPPQVAHLRKLAPRLPRTITRFDIAADGGLDAIHQWVLQANGIALDVTIPVDRLVMFVNEREGSDWTGTSVLRSAYKNWLIKDALIRLGPVSVERNGMGFPLVNYPAGGDKALALEFARSIRAGEDAGGALPEGYTAELLGVKGTLKDELPLLKYHDESIGRNLLAMILDLGHDAGARALGTVFADLFAASLNAVVGNIEETVTEHIIRDLVALNFGEDEAYPELVADEIQADAVLSAQDLQMLVEAGVVLPDRDLEADIRRRYGLPALPDPEELDDGVVDIHARPGELPPGEDTGPLAPGLPSPQGPVSPPVMDQPPAPAVTAAAAAPPASSPRSRAELERRLEAARRRLAQRR